MINKYDPSLIISKPVAWTNEVNEAYYGVCGHSNKIFSITNHPLAKYLVVDVLIGLKGCAEEGCEEEYRCLNHTCEYCKANNFKEAIENMCQNCSNWNIEDYDENTIRILEKKIKRIEEILWKNICLPVTSCCNKLEVKENEF